MDKKAQHIEAGTYMYAKDAAAQLDMSTKTFINICLTGAVPGAVRVGNEHRAIWLIKVDTFHKWAEKRRQEISNKPRVMLYFIQSGDGQPIKIGLSNNIPKRMQILQIGSPDKFQLLAAIPGNPITEVQLHQRFATARISGEWFKPTTDLLDFIQSLNQQP